MITVLENSTEASFIQQLQKGEIVEYTDSTFAAISGKFIYLDEPVFGRYALLLNLTKNPQNQWVILYLQVPGGYNFFPDELKSVLEKTFSDVILVNAGMLAQKRKMINHLELGENPSNFREYYSKDKGVATLLEVAAIMNKKERDSSASKSVFFKPKSTTQQPNVSETELLSPMIKVKK